MAIHHLPLRGEASGWTRGSECNLNTALRPSLEFAIDPIAWVIGSGGGDAAAGEALQPADENPIDAAIRGFDRQAIEGVDDPRRGKQFRKGRIVTRGVQIAHQ